KFENSKKTLDVILRFKDTVCILQELLTVNKNIFIRKPISIGDTEQITIHLIKESPKCRTFIANIQKSFYMRSYHLQKTLVKHNYSKKTCFLEVITLIKKTTNKDFKIIFLAGLNSLLKKKNFYYKCKILRTLVLLHLYEHENKRFDINWNQYFIEILSSQNKKYKIYGDRQTFAELKDLDLSYKGYILMNIGDVCISKKFSEYLNQDKLYIEETKRLIDIVTRLKCKLYNIFY
ncbi:MAG: hypothetical protein ACRCZW_12565, partial [Lactobacillaceae bacterium]